MRQLDYTHERSRSTPTDATASMIAGGQAYMRHGPTAGP